MTTRKTENANGNAQPPHPSPRLRAFRDLGGDACAGRRRRSTWKPPRRRGRSSGIRRPRSRRRRSSRTCSSSSTGIKVELFRSGGSAILRRFLQETQAGRVAVDVLTHSDPAAASAMAGRACSCRSSRPLGQGAGRGQGPGRQLGRPAPQPDGDLLPHRQGAGRRRPKTWVDLTDPKYKGSSSPPIRPSPRFRSPWSA